MSSIDKLIKGCVKQDAQSMEKLYNMFAPAMWVLCLRYTRNKMMAEDVMQEGFMRVYNQIQNFKKTGALEGWMKRIFISTAVNYYKRYYRFNKLDIDPINNKHLEPAEANFNSAIEKIEAEDLLCLIDTLPPGYKIVFSLFAIEGYSHKEIANMLGCTESNSKTQLARARVKLREKVLTQNKTSHSNKKLICQKKSSL